MSPSLPRHPNVGLLKKQAKMLLAAQRRGEAPSCNLFRRLGRFSSHRDEEILGAQVSLAEAQVALAIHYGHRSWKELIDEASSYPPSDEFSLAAARGRSEEIIPDYAGAGVPLGVVAALNQAGVSVGFMEFAAASGWAFSFGYLYGDISPAHMAVRGRPGADGPFEVFAFLPQEYGLGYEHALTSEPDRLWSFVKERVDSGVAIMSAVAKAQVDAAAPQFGRNQPARLPGKRQRALRVRAVLAADDPHRRDRRESLAESLHAAASWSTAMIGDGLLSARTSSTRSVICCGDS